MLGWSPFEYHTSSPCEFYYACKGYFSKEENRMLIMRKVAFAAVAPYINDGDFESFWPYGNNEIKTPSFAETPKEMIADILKAWNIK